MTVRIIDSEETGTKVVAKVLKSNGIENVASKVPTKKLDEVKNTDTIDVFKMRQIEQKQELLVGLTNVLFKKFEDIHPTKKFSKFEFTDLSWYKKLGTSQ
jgi:hypothetical protein